MHKVPGTEIIRVNDLIGLISRKVRQGPVIPVVKYPPVPTKAPPAPLATHETSYIAQALSAYNGWIPFDVWLNHADTKWNQCSLVARVLSANPIKALTYLSACDVQADIQTAGYLRGKIAAMEGICLLRQIYMHVQQGVYSNPQDCVADVTRFIRLVSATSSSAAVANDMYSIARSSGSLEEFELRWFSTITPVNNMIHAARIFKNRVKKTVLYECLSLLHQRKWEANFGLYYFLGVMSRLDTFDLYDPYWHEDTLRPLHNLFFLFSQIEGMDYDFTRRMFYTFIPLLRAKQPIQVEGIYIIFIAWFLYKSALHGKSLASAAESLSIWEKQLAISIRSNPHVLTGLYRELAYYDLAYAEREVSKVIVIVDLSQKISF